MSDEKEKEQPTPEAPPEKQDEGGQVTPANVDPGGQPGGGGHH